MNRKPICVVMPRFENLDEYMARAEKLSSLLSEADRLYGELKDMQLEVGYEVFMPTSNSKPQDGHYPSPDERRTLEPHDGH